MRRAPRTNPQKAVDDWNSVYRVGTPVRYWSGTREGEGKTGETEASAFVLGGHTACVFVSGHSGCIALTHVEPMEERIEKVS